MFLLAFAILAFIKSENTKNTLLSTILYKTQKQLSFTAIVYFLVLIYFQLFTFLLFICLMF
jgi:hypothetical protein